MGLRVRDGSARRPVRPPVLPGRRLLQDPRGVDRLPVLDHLLERRQRLHPGHAAPRHRVHVVSAPLAGERRSAGRHHPPGQHQAGRGRHRRRHLQRPVQPAVPRAQVHRASRRVLQRLRDRGHDGRASGPARGVHRRQEHPGTHQVRLRDLPLRRPHQLGRPATTRATSSSRLPTTGKTNLPDSRGSTKIPRSQPAHHPHRPARVRVHGSQGELPRRPRTAARTQVGRRRASATKRRWAPRGPRSILFS